MFDFEKLSVYQKAKAFDSTVLFLVCSQTEIDRVILNQLKKELL